MMPRLLRSVAVTLGLLTCIAAAPDSAKARRATGKEQAQAETRAGWVKAPESPVLGGELGTCFDVALLKEGGRFRMWFSWRPKRSVALVESIDGVNWSKPVIVLGPNKDTDWEGRINRPVVVKRPDGYHLWYTGQTGTESFIGHATSSDGVTWKRTGTKPVLSSEAPWEKVAVMCPHVIWDDEGRLFRMWYSGGEQYEPNAIGYATSPDGRTWTKHQANPVFRADPKSQWEKHKVTACQVVRHGGWHVMFYIGFRDEHHAQIGLARSRDGLTGWQRHPANPIIRPGAGKWDGDACYKPFAIFSGGRWMLWYNGRHKRVEQIGLAIHEGEDLGFPVGKTASARLRLFDGKPKTFVVNGYSTSFHWPKILQRKLDRHFGKRVIEVRSATRGGTPIAKWIDVATGEPKEAWLSTVRPALERRGGAPVIVLAQQSLQWALGDRRAGIRNKDDAERIRRGADALEKYARLMRKDGADLVFIAMHIYKKPMEPEIGNERLALAALLKRKVPGIAAGPDVWTPTSRLWPQAFARDKVHPNQMGAEVMAQHWFETVLAYDGLKAPAWSRDEMQKAVRTAPQTGRR